MFPSERTETPATASAATAGFQSGTSEEYRGDRKIKTTKISFADMVARAKAGFDTSIKGI